MRKLTLAFILLSLFVQSLHTAWAGVDFDATDDILACGATDDVLTENGAVTIYARVTPEGDPENNDGYIVTRTSQGTNDRVAFHISSASEQLDFFVAGNSYVARQSNTSAFSHNVEQVWIMTWDGSATGTNIHIYVNGSEVSYVSSSDGATIYDNSTQTLRIGNADTGARTFNGIIHEVALWNSVLSANEIAQLSASGPKRLPLQISPSNLKRYYSLDECSDGASCATASMFKDGTGVTSNDCSPSNNPTGSASRQAYP